MSYLILMDRIREYEYGQLTHQLKLHDPISAVETLEDESFVLPSLIPVKNAINTSASVKQIITEMVSAENIEQGKKDRVDKKGSVDDTNHFSSKDSQKSFSMDIVDKNYESTKTPPNFISTKKQRVWPCSPHKNTTYEKPNHYSGMLKNRKSPGHYHVGEHSSPPFITTELPISGASSSGYLDILNKKENIYGKVISTTPYLNKNRSGSDSIERNSTSPFYPSNENLNSSMYGHTSSFDIYRKHSETYRQWHKRRRQSFGHRSLRPSDSSAEIINENVSCLNNSSTSPFQQALSRAMKMTSQQVRCYDESDPSETEGLGVLSYPLNISQPLSFHPITRQMITGRRMWEGEERVETFDLSNDTDLVGYWKGITTEEAAGYKSPSIPRTSMQSVLSVDHRPNLDTTKQPNCLPVSPMTYCYETEEVYDLFGKYSEFRY
ncbi:hypothetical protein BDF14DRAFT_1187938 [Spinellus fusiger]|nr:hypothetical protein BDF14DRAFT_1187938 [Spinellus fusiger]